MHMARGQAEKIALELADKRAERAVLRLLARAQREVRSGTAYWHADGSMCLGN